MSEWSEIDTSMIPPPMTEPPPPPVGNLDIAAVERLIVSLRDERDKLRADLMRLVDMVTYATEDAYLLIEMQAQLRELAQDLKAQR